MSWGRPAGKQAAHTDLLVRSSMGEGVRPQRLVSNATFLLQAPLKEAIMATQPRLTLLLQCPIPVAREHLGAELICVCSTECSLCIKYTRVELRDIF